MPRWSRLPPVAWWTAWRRRQMVVGGQGQDADRAAEPVVGPAAAEERAMAAVVLDHEQAHQEARGRDGQEQGQAVAGVAQAEPHQEPQGRERHGGDGQFGQAAGKAGLAVGCQDLRPAAGIVDGMRFSQRSWARDVQLWMGKGANWDAGNKPAVTPAPATRLCAAGREGGRLLARVLTAPSAWSALSCATSHGGRQGRPAGPMRDMQMTAVDETRPPFSPATERPIPAPPSPPA